MYLEVSAAQSRQEKEKARELRQSRWWQAQLDSAACHYCRKALARKDVTMDHILPICQGGRSTKGNVVPACKDCNTLKRDMSAIEWELRQEKLATEASAGSGS